MFADMLMQVSEMISLEITDLISFLVMYPGPGTNEFMRNFWFNDFVASICGAFALNVTITQMMLCGDYISKDSRTKRTLVGDNHHIDKIAKIVSWKLRFHLMMNTFAFRMAFEITSDSFSNMNITLYNMRGLVAVISLLFAVKMSVVMHIYSPEFFKVYFSKPVPGFRVCEKALWLISNLRNKCMVIVCSKRHSLQIINHLPGKGIFIGIAFVPFKFAKPGSK